MKRITTAGILRFSALTVLAALSLEPAAYADSPRFYRLQSAVTVPGASPSWDYLNYDAAHDRLFVARRKDGMAVYDAKEAKVVKTIDRSEDAGSVALAPEFGRGYTANEDGSTTIFDLNTLDTIDRVKFGEDADSGFYDPVTKQVIFTQGDSKSFTFLDARTGKVVGKLAADSDKLDGTVADGKGNFFTVLRDKNALVRIDAKARKVTARWPTTGCEQPTGLAIDLQGRRLFVGCRGKDPVLLVMDADQGKVVARQVIGHGNDGVAYDAESHKVYTSNGVDANLVVFDQTDPDSYKLDQAVTTRPYARTMALDPATKRVFTVAAEGVADPLKKINAAVAPFYPNRYFDDSFTIFTYALK